MGCAAHSIQNGRNPGSTLRCILLTADNTKVCTKILLISLRHKFFVQKRGGEELIFMLFMTDRHFFVKFSYICSVEYRASVEIMYSGTAEDLLDFVLLCRLRLSCMNLSCGEESGKEGEAMVAVGRSERSCTGRMEKAPVFKEKRDILTVFMSKMLAKIGWARLSLLVCVATVLFSCSQNMGRFVDIDGYMLGTTFHVSARTNSQSVDIYKRIMDVDAQMKASMSVFDESSLLSRINDNRTDSIDQHIYNNLCLAEHIFNVSGGSYDVTVKPLVDAYGFINGVPGNVVNVDSIMEFVGFDKLSYDMFFIKKSDERVALDFNSIAKGYTVDLVAAELESFGVKDYIVEIGGEVRCRGLNSKKGAWRVGVETPYDGNISVGSSVQQILSLTDCAMATSGNYRRYFIDDKGNKVAHIIDPRTGESAVTDLLSATVIAPTCAMADAYATMFVALGTERAVEVAKSLASEGVMVYLISAGEGDKFNVFYSAKLAPMMSHTKGYTAI